MTTLTERYLYAATRNLPETQRLELRRELAERIGDDIDARVQDGAEPVEAETAALTDLGDPDALVARYLDRPLHLIGPQLFPTWKRLLKLLLAIVLPVVAVFYPMAQLLAGQSWGAIAGGLFVVLLTTAVHLGFWATLVFAILDRSLGGRPVMEWTPEFLPEVSSPSRNAVRWDVGANLVFIALAAVAIFTHTAFLPFRDAAGATVPLFEPATWQWLPWVLLGVLAADVVFWGILYRRGSWDYALAAARTVLSAAYAAPFAWAFASGRLINPEFVALTGWADGRSLLAEGGTLAIVFAFMVVGIAAIWPIDAFVKARHASRVG